MIKIDQKIILEWQELVQRGQGHLLRANLQKLSARKVNREQLLPLANLARRVNMPRFSLQLLYSVIRPSYGDSNATSQELAEYAAALSAIGAYKEADLTLDEVNISDCSEALLFRAFINIFTWNYRQAIPFLQAFLKAENRPYQLLVANINLIAALIHVEDFSPALLKITELKETVRRQNLQLLLGNLLELEAQIAILKSDYGVAEELLLKSEKVLVQTGNVSLIYTKKWQAVISARKNSKNIGELDRVKKQAKEMKDWETVRDCELYKSLIGNDSLLFTQIYYGSPYAGYRKLILQRDGRPSHVPEEFFLNPKKSGTAWPQCFNIHQGTLTREILPLKPNQLIHRFLKVLCSDLYRPILVGSLFSKLFPDDYYNPNTSPDRVYQCIKRSRSWCAKNKFNLTIKPVSDGYLFHLQGKSSLLYNKAYLDQDFTKPLADERIMLLVKEFSENPFSSKYACHVLSMPLRSVNRFLKEKVGEGEIVQVGRGPTTKYKLSG